MIANRNHPMQMGGYAAGSRPGRVRARLGVWARVWRGRDGVGFGAAVPAVAGGVDLAGVPQMAPVEIRPEGIEKDQFSVGGLPEQEVGKALLAG